ncbi:MAG: hypothetical protein PWP72_1641 [Thermoanaerobacter sp.]|nr:hypothetical protein [Thermoanaerobacter sp.]
MGFLSRSKGSILLVEDSTLTRFYSRRLLENNGYEVAEAASGEEALVKIRERLDPFDLVIIDINLPGIDGLTTIEKIKAIPHYRYVPVMILTVEAKISTVKQAIQVGAIEYLCKPFSSEQLLQRVERLIGRSEDPREILERLLRLEINRAKRGNSKFSLVLAQRTAAGRFNTASVKRILQKKLREIDEVLMLDDNLLALVLPLTDKEGAATVIKKLQEWVAEKGWRFGLAVYPENGGNGKELFGYAQTAISRS